jgi:hypothetical protein
MQPQLANITDRLAALETLRDRLAQEIDRCDNPRDIPGLALRYTDVMAQIDDMPQARSTSKADEIAARRTARRGADPAHSARAANRSG